MQLSERWGVRTGAQLTSLRRKLQPNGAGPQSDQKGLLTHTAAFRVLIEEAFEDADAIHYKEWKENGIRQVHLAQREDVHPCLCHISLLFSRLIPSLRCCFLQCDCMD